MGVPSNELVNWNPTIPIPQSIYDGTNTTQQAPLGTRLIVGERTFYYANAAASFAAGQVVCQTSPVASHQSGLLEIAAASANTQVLSATSSANVAANLYAEGYFGAALGAGKGQMYRVRSQASGSAAMAVTLYDPLQVALTSGAVFWLVQNMYKSVNVGSAALGNPVGVAPLNITSGGYFWLQTFGPANPLHTGATVAAGALAMGTLGTVTALSVTGTLGSTGFAAIDYIVPIGKNLNLAATASECNPAYISIRQ